MSLSLCVDALGQCPTGSSSSAFTLNISDKHAKPPTGAIYSISRVEWF